MAEGGWFPPSPAFPRFRAWPAFKSPAPIPFAGPTVVLMALTLSKVAVGMPARFAPRHSPSCLHPAYGIRGRGNFAPMNRMKASPSLFPGVTPLTLHGRCSLHQNMDSGLQKCPSPPLGAAGVYKELEICRNKSICKRRISDGSYSA